MLLRKGRAAGRSSRPDREIDYLDENWFSILVAQRCPSTPLLPNFSSFLSFHDALILKMVDVMYICRAGKVFRSEAVQLPSCPLSLLPFLLPFYVSHFFLFLWIGWGRSLIIQSIYLFQVHRLMSILLMRSRCVLFSLMSLINIFAPSRLMTATSTRCICLHFPPDDDISVIPRHSRSGYDSGQG